MARRRCWLREGRAAGRQLRAGGGSLGWALGRGELGGLVAEGCWVLGGWQLSVRGGVVRLGPGAGCVPGGEPAEWGGGVTVGDQFGGGYERQARGKLFAGVPAPLASGIRKESGKAHTAHTLLRAGTRNPYRNHAWRAPWQLSSPRKIYVRSTDVCGW